MLAFWQYYLRQLRLSFPALVAGIAEIGRGVYLRKAFYILCRFDYKISRIHQAVVIYIDFVSFLSVSALFKNLLKAMYPLQLWKNTLTIIEQILWTLVENPMLGSLAIMDQDPKNGNQPIRRFYLLCHGLRHNSTKDIINTATKYLKKSLVILETSSDEAIVSSMDPPAEQRPYQAGRSLPILLPSRHTVLSVKGFQWRGWNSSIF